jgi:hypothetical protein
MGMNLTTQYILYPLKHFMINAPIGILRTFFSKNAVKSTISNLTYPIFWLSGCDFQ